MHGFFIHVGLYNRIRAVAKPFEYKEYRSQKIKERMEEKRASRIAPKTNPQKINAKVNPDLADRLQAKSGAKTKAGKAAKSLVEDDRFGGLFSNPDFEIDEEAEDFKLRNPSGVASTKVRNDRDMDSDQDDDDDDDEGDNLDASGFTKINNENEKWGSESDDDEGQNDYYDSDSDEDGFQGGKIRGELYENNRKSSKDKKKKDVKKNKAKKKKKNVMYEADDYVGGGANAIDIGIGNVSAEADANKRKKEMSLSMAERLQLQSDESKFVGDTKRLKVTGQGSVKEVTFIPKATRKKLEAQEKARQEAQVKDDRVGRSRRGVKSLGFKTPFKHHQ